MPTPTLPERCPACDSDLPNEPSLCLNTNHPPGTPHVLCDNPFHAPMPTPPLPPRDDDEHGAPGEGEAVTLWAYRKRNGDFMYDSNKIDDLDVEMRALPVAAYEALLARANAAKVAAELMRDRAEKAERFLSMLFESHWDGTIGRPPTWHLRGDFRHILAGMRGETLEAAIEALGREGA